MGLGLGQGLSALPSKQTHELLGLKDPEGSYRTTQRPQANLLAVVPSGGDRIQGLGQLGKCST